MIVYLFNKTIQCLYKSLKIRGPQTQIVIKMFYLANSMSLLLLKLGQRDVQDGGSVSCGDHLPPHKYIRNTPTRGTTPTEHLLNAGRRPQTSQKARNSPHTGGGQKKKEKKTETKE